jgi:hypothetical protein
METTTFALEVEWTSEIRQSSARTGLLAKEVALETREARD